MCTTATCMGVITQQQQFNVRLVLAVDIDYRFKVIDSLEMDH